jgi:hypothetical protein
MLKKLFNVFKKKQEPVVEPEVEEVIETVEPDRAEWTQDVYIIESVDEEQAKSFDVDTKFRFEVYVGTSEDNVKLVNEHDFDTVEEAKSFGEIWASKNIDSETMVIIFIHEETIDDNGQSVTNRHY